MGLEALLVLLFFFLPGLIADWVYRFLRWVPDPSDGTLFVRATLFSGAGLLLLVVLDPPNCKDQFTSGLLALRLDTSRSF